MPYPTSLSDTVVLTLVLVFPSALAMNPCNSSSSFTPTVDPQMGGSNCQFMADNLPTFTPSPTSCSQQTLWASNTQSRAMHVLMLADKCCGNNGAKAHVCMDHTLQICADQTQFNGKADAGVGGAWCLMVVTDNMAAFTASSTTCSETIAFGGSTGSRRDILNRISPACCGNTANVCAQYPANSGPSTTSHAVSEGIAPLVSAIVFSAFARARM